MLYMMGTMSTFEVVACVVAPAVLRGAPSASVPSGTASGAGLQLPPS